MSLFILSLKIQITLFSLEKIPFFSLLRNGLLKVMANGIELKQFFNSDLIFSLYLIIK